MVYYKSGNYGKNTLTFGQDIFGKGIFSKKFLVKNTLTYGKIP